MQKPTILIIEGDRDLAAVLADILGMEGFTPLVWHSEGNLKDLSWPVDIVVCSVRLSTRTSGIRILKQVRLHPLTRHIPFIMTDTYADDTLMRRALRLGADYYLLKPFRIEQLLHVTNRLLGSRAAMVGY